MASEQAKEFLTSFFLGNALYLAVKSKKDPLMNYLRIMTQEVDELIQIGEKYAENGVSTRERNHYIATHFMEKMKDMLLKFLRLDRLVDSMINYLESRVDLVKMEVREEVANIFSRGLLIMIIFLFGFLFLLFLSIGLAEYLNGFFHGEYVGYLILSGFFGIVLVLLILFRKNFFRALEKQFGHMIRQK